MSSISRHISLALGMALVASTAAPALGAPAWDRMVIVEPWEETITCGDVVGEATGTVVQRVQTRQNEDGAVEFRLTERVQDVTFAGSDGRTYQVVGSGTASGLFEPEFVMERQVINLVIVGPGGKLGAIHFRYDDTGQSLTGGCTF
jgi:hypothetical protein